MQGLAHIFLLEKQLVVLKRYVLDGLQILGWRFGLASSQLEFLSNVHLNVLLSFVNLEFTLFIEFEYSFTAYL